jgi:hypothetical protein
MSSPKTCVPHERGVSPGMRPFYVPGCPRCEQKRAAGIVTGDEGPPPDMRVINHQFRLAAAAGRRGVR